MQKIFYAADSYVNAYGQSTYLKIVKTLSGDIYGVSFEFEICTKEIKKACIPKGVAFEEGDKKFEEVEWIEYSSEIGTNPASFNDILDADLSDFISGYQLEKEVNIHRF